MLSKNLVKKSGLYFIGNLSSKIMSSLLIPIYAFYISANDLGLFDLSQTIMGIATPIIIFAIWESVLKFILSEDSELIKRQIVTTSASFTLLMSSLLIILVLILGYRINIDYYLLWIIVLMIIINTFVNVWQYYSRAFGYNKLFVISGITATIINFTFVVLLVILFNYGIMGLFISFIIGQLSIVFIIERKVKVIKMFSLRDIKLNVLKKMLIFSSPLVLNLISAWAISGFGKILIIYNIDTEANGIYSFSNKFSLIITMIGTVITMAIIEEAIIAFKQKGKDSDFGKAIDSLFIIFLSIACLAIPVISIFYSLIKHTEYYSSIVFVPGLIIYAVANTMASNIGAIFQAVDKTKYQFLTTMFGGVITIVFATLLISEWGIMAIVISQILGATVMLISRYILINKFIKISIKWTPIFYITMLYILIAYVSLNTNLIVCVLLELSMILVLYKKNEKIIKSGARNIKRKLVKNDIK